MEKIEDDIRRLIVEALNLEDMAAEDIDPAEPLFNDGLGLDSIDALEIGVELQKRFGIKIDPDDDRISDHFYSVRTLARFIAEQQQAVS